MINKVIFRSVAQKFAKARKRSFADPIAKRDMAASIGRRTEGRFLDKGLKRIRARALSIFGSKGHYEKIPNKNYKRLSPKGKRAKAAFTKASFKVTKIAKRKGLESFTKASKKLGVTPSGIKDRPPQFYRQAKRGLPKGMTTQQMGWAPEDPFDATQKAFYAKGKPMPKIKAYRKTLEKVYKTKKSWKDRSRVIKETRQKIKGQIKLAKMDRHASLYTTAQQQTGTTRTGKPIWKTIRRYDVGDLTKWNIKKPK